MQGRTTFLISHRPNAFKNCDVVLVVDNGRLVAQASDFFTLANSASGFSGGQVSAREEPSR